MICTLQCVIGCQCPAGLFRVAGTSHCVAQDMCPPRKSLLVLWSLTHAQSRIANTNQILLVTAPYPCCKLYLNDNPKKYRSKTVSRYHQFKCWSINSPVNAHCIQPQNTDTYVIKRLSVISNIHNFLIFVKFIISCSHALSLIFCFHANRLII